MIEHVLEAKAAVADLTGPNAHVFYELAARHTARLPVALIAHVDDRARLPFDTAQMRTIFYDHQDLKSAADCRTQNTAQLREALERSAVDSPVAASVDLAYLQGGNPSEQVLAQLVSTVERIAAEVARSREEISYQTDGIRLDVAELEDRIQIDRDAISAIVEGFDTLQDVIARREDEELAEVGLRMAAAIEYLGRKIRTHEPNEPSERTRRRAAGVRRSVRTSARRKTGDQAMPRSGPPG